MSFFYKILKFKLFKITIKEGRKIPEGQSNSQIENKLTTPWLKNKKINRQIIVQDTT